jgi:hypothetical protein
LILDPRTLLFVVRADESNLPLEACWIVGAFHDDVTTAGMVSRAFKPQEDFIIHYDRTMDSSRDSTATSTVFLHQRSKFNVQRFTRSSPFHSSAKAYSQLAFALIPAARGPTRLRGATKAGYMHHMRQKIKAFQLPPDDKQLIFTSVNLRSPLGVAFLISHRNHRLFHDTPVPPTVPYR